MFALREKWPNILVQFEDFNSDNAYPILTRNRKKYLCFNDDIQGTGAVALGGIYAALKVQGNKPSDLKHQVKKNKNQTFYSNIPIFFLSC